MGEFGDGPNFFPARQIFPISKQFLHAAQDGGRGMQFLKGDGGVMLDEICRGFLFTEGADEGAADHG